MELNLTEEQEERCDKLNLTQESKIRIASNLLEKYHRLDKELEKYRDCSSLKDGWQTARLAKKQRSAEELSKEKTIIRNILFEDWNIDI